MKKLLLLFVCLACAVILIAQPNRVPGPQFVVPLGVSSGDVVNIINQISNFTQSITFSSNVTINVLIVTNYAYFNTITNNIFSNTNIVNLITVNVSGKASFTSNAYFLSIFYKTNTMSTITIDVNKTTESLSTNDAIVFTGYSNVDGTNVIPFSRIITNTAGSAAPKPITFPVGTLMLSSPFTNVVYNTNQGVFSGLIWPGFGTNGTWTGN